jgi:hypothetical protein
VAFIMLSSAGGTCIMMSCETIRQTTVGLPAMRYYGGQKSPMWRG